MVPLQPQPVPLASIRYGKQTWRVSTSGNEVVNLIANNNWAMPEGCKCLPDTVQHTRGVFAFNLLGFDGSGTNVDGSVAGASEAGVVAVIFFAFCASAVSVTVAALRFFSAAESVVEGDKSGGRGIWKAATFGGSDLSASRWNHRAN